MDATSSSAADIFARALHGAGASASSSTATSTSPVPPAATSSNSTIGGFLVCLDVPAGTEFGVDYEVFRTGAAFRGVKFLPLGVHLVVFRAREQQHGVRQGFFVRVERAAQVLVREWSAEKEELGPPRAGLNLEHLERACNSVVLCCCLQSLTAYIMCMCVCTTGAVLSFQLDSGLGAYPMQHYTIWTRLTKFVSESVLQVG